MSKHTPGPGWKWVVGMAIRLTYDKTANPKTRKAFVDEACRLGSFMKPLFKDLKNKRTAKAAEQFLMEKAKQADDAIAKAEGI